MQTVIKKIKVVSLRICRSQSHNKRHESIRKKKVTHIFALFPAYCLKYSKEIYDIKISQYIWMTSVVGNKTNQQIYRTYLQTDISFLSCIPNGERFGILETMLYHTAMMILCL